MDFPWYINKGNHQFYQLYLDTWIIQLFNFLFLSLCSRLSFSFSSTIIHLAYKSYIFLGINGWHMRCQNSVWAWVNSYEKKVPQHTSDLPMFREKSTSLRDRFREEVTTFREEGSSLAGRLRWRKQIQKFKMSLPFRNHRWMMSKKTCKKFVSTPNKPKVILQYRWQYRRLGKGLVN